MDKRKKLMENFNKKFGSKNLDDQNESIHIKKSRISPSSIKRTPSNSKSSSRSKPSLSKSPSNRNKPNFIGNLYANYSSTTDNYISQNHQNIILYGNSLYPHTPTKSLLGKIKGEQNNIIKGINMKTLKYGNPVFEGNDEQLPLTPLPKSINQIDEISKNDKNEFLKTERKVVLMRQIEYTRISAERKANKNSLSPNRISYNEEKKLNMIVKYIQKWWRSLKRKHLPQYNHTFIQHKRQTMKNKKIIKKDMQLSISKGRISSSPIIGRNKYNYYLHSESNASFNKNQFIYLLIKYFSMKLIRIKRIVFEMLVMCYKKKKKKPKVNKKYKRKQCLFSKQHKQLKNKNNAIILIQNNIRQMLKRKRIGEFLKLIKKTILYQDHMEMINNVNKYQIENNEKMQLIGKGREYDIVKTGDAFIINGKYYVELDKYNNYESNYTQTDIIRNDNLKYRISNETFCVSSVNNKCHYNKENINSNKKNIIISKQTNTIEIITNAKHTNDNDTKKRKKISLEINQNPNIYEKSIPLQKPIPSSSTFTKITYPFMSTIFSQLSFLQHSIKRFLSQSKSFPPVLTLPTSTIPLCFLSKKYYSHLKSLSYTSSQESHPISYDTSTNNSYKNIKKSTSYIKPQPTNIKLLSQNYKNKQTINDQYKARSQIRNQIITRNKSSDSAITRCENLNLSLNMHQLSNLHKLKAKRLPNVVHSLLNKRIISIYRDIFNKLKYYSPQQNILYTLLYIKWKLAIRGEFYIWKTKCQNQNVYFKKRATFTTISYHRSNTMNTTSIRHTLTLYNIGSSKIERFINIIKYISYSNFFYRLVLKNLFLNGININNNEIITYIKKGMEKGYIYTLWNVLALNLTENEVGLEKRRNFIKYMKIYDQLNTKGNGTVISRGTNVFVLPVNVGNYNYDNRSYNMFGRINSISVDEPRSYRRYRENEEYDNEMNYSREIRYTKTDVGNGQGQNMQRPAIIMKNITFKK